MEKIMKCLIITISSIFLIFIVLITICMFLDFFTIDTVRIVNNEKHDDSYYMQEVSSLIGENGFKVLVKDINSLRGFFIVFALRDNKIENRYLSDDPYVKSVKVSFLPPDKIMVEIVERQECFMISFLDSKIVLSKDLIVLGEDDGSNVPEIKGLDIGSYEEGTQIQIGSGIRDALEEIYGNSVYNGRDIIDQIREIDFGEGLSLTLENGVTVIFGSFEDIGYKMKCLNEIYYEYLHGYDNGELDLTDTDKKVYRPG